MLNEALKSLRALFLTSIGVLLLWLVTWPTAVEKLEHFRQALHLHAWLSLRELILTPELTDEVFRVAVDESIGSFEVERESPFPQGSAFGETVPLRLQTAWPTEEALEIRLIPESYYLKSSPDIEQHARIFRVESASAHLPLSDYLAVFSMNRVFVVMAEDQGFRSDSQRGLRWLHVAGMSRDRPLHWSEITNRLGTYGYSGSLSELTSTHEAVRALYAASDPRSPTTGVKIFGLPLSIHSFFLGVGVLFAGIAFACIGPIHRLQAARDSSNQSWILCLPKSQGAASRFLEWCIVAVSLAWALSPLMIALLQSSVPGVPGYEGRALKTLGSVGLLFATCVFCVAAWHLRRVRAEQAAANQVS